MEEKDKRKGKKLTKKQELEERVMAIEKLLIIDDEQISSVLFLVTTIRGQQSHIMQLEARDGTFQQFISENKLSDMFNDWMKKKIEANASPIEEAGEPSLEEDAPVPDTPDNIKDKGGVIEHAPVQQPPPPPPVPEDNPETQE